MPHPPTVMAGKPPYPTPSWPGLTRPSTPADENDDTQVDSPDPWRSRRLRRITTAPSMLPRAELCPPAGVDGRIKSGHDDQGWHNPPARLNARPRP